MISNQNALLWGYGSRHDNVIENGFVEERLFSAKNFELLTIRAANWKTNARMLEFKSTDFTLMLPNILVVIFFSRYYKSRLQQCCDTIIKGFSVGWTITISWSLHFTIKVFFLIFFANHFVCFDINLYDNNFKSTCYTRIWWVRHIYIYIICHRFLWNIMRYWLRVRISMWKVVYYAEETEES